MNYKKTQPYINLGSRKCAFFHRKKIKLDEMRHIQERSGSPDDIIADGIPIEELEWKELDKTPSLLHPIEKSAWFTGPDAITLHCWMPFWATSRNLEHTHSHRGPAVRWLQLACSLNPVCFGAEMQTENLTVLIFGTQNSFWLKYWTCKLRPKLFPHGRKDTKLEMIEALLHSRGGQAWGFNCGSETGTGIW